MEASLNFFTLIATVINIMTLMVAIFPIYLKIKSHTKSRNSLISAVLCTGTGLLIMMRINPTAVTLLSSYHTEAVRVIAPAIISLILMTAWVFSLNYFPNLVQHCYREAGSIVKGRQNGLDAVIKKKDRLINLIQLFFVVSLAAIFYIFMACIAITPAHIDKAVENFEGATEEIKAQRQITGSTAVDENRNKVCRLLTTLTTVAKDIKSDRESMIDKDKKKPSKTTMTFDRKIDLELQMIGASTEDLSSQIQKKCAVFLQTKNQVQATHVQLLKLIEKHKVDPTTLDIDPLKWPAEASDISIRQSIDEELAKYLSKSICRGLLYGACESGIPIRERIFLSLIYVKDGAAHDVFALLSVLMELLALIIIAFLAICDAYAEEAEA